MVVSFLIQLLSCFLCLGSSLHLRNRHCHMWVRYIETTIITVCCLSLLLLSIDIQLLCYLIMFYFKLTNGKMLKWWMLKWYNCEVKIGISRFVSHKCLMCSFVLFSNTTFLQQTKQSITFNFLSLTTITETKFMLSNQANTEKRGFFKDQLIVVKEILTLI